MALAESIPGAAVATTTTLLAALWPSRHFVFDWRVRAAANGLRIEGGLEPAPSISPDSIAALAITFADYCLVRGWVLETAQRTGEPPHAVERALYRLSQQVPAVKGRSWREYADEMARLLA